MNIYAKILDNIICLFTIRLFMQKFCIKFQHEKNVICAAIFAIYMHFNCKYCLRLLRGALTTTKPDEI